MKIKINSWILIGLLSLVACDPVHSLRLENKTNEKIEILYYPDLDIQNLGDRQIKKVNNGQEMNSVSLDSAETIRIGNVTARYNPKPSDIDLDYLEIRMNQDTLKLTGKNAIFSTLQKVDKLDWRIIIRTE
jgi:hypothetical protein